MFELNQLEHFITIVEEKTISKAAEKLLISQPALSRSLQKFEDDLGIMLFDRTKNKIEINKNGTFVYKLAKKLLNQANEMNYAINEYINKNTTINLGSIAPAPAWAINYLVNTKLSVSEYNETIENSSESLISNFSNNKYDLLILNTAINDNKYLSIMLFEENLYISLPKNHRLAKNKTINFDDINGESVLLLSKIGFWNEICLKNIPDSHLLIQTDSKIFNELTKSSDIPHFRTNITILENINENRVNIPIENKDAKAVYYLIIKKKDINKFSFLKNNLQDLNWRKVFEFLRNK